MRALPLVLALAIAHGCTPRQVRITHRTGELMTGGGLIGLLATGVTAALLPSHEDTLATVGIGFIPVAVVGALLFITTDSASGRDREPKLTRRERHQLAAWELTKQAAVAARERDCTQVQAIAPRVRELFHTVVFMRDVAILRCLRER